jgi:SAM-dependent methyltransferase
MGAMDPLAGSPWVTPTTVEGFVRSPPNEILLAFAAAELDGRGRGRLLDIGCGAARNGAPLAQLGWDVIGIDLSWPMLLAAADRVPTTGRHGRLHFAVAPMDSIPLTNQSVDFIVAHGIWNLAPSAAMFRRAVAEAARVAKPHAPLFVFTFSRHTLPAEAQPLSGEPFVFTQFSGQPQSFLSEGELIAELEALGFVVEPGHPIREYNRPTAGTMIRGSGPVIYEGIFRKRA